MTPGEKREAVFGVIWGAVEGGSQTMVSSMAMFNQYGEFSRLLDFAESPKPDRH